jgi:hypothetical protein
MAELTDLFTAGLSLRGAHAQSERRLERALSAFERNELHTPDAARAVLEEGVACCHDLGEWCDPTRRAAALPWVRTFDVHSDELAGQLHRHRWPKCTTAAGACVEHRHALAAMVDSVSPAATVHTAAESTLRIGALEARIRHGALSEADVLGVMAQLHDSHEWVQPVDDAEEARLRRVLAAAEPHLSELARQLHSHTFPSCQHWPKCEHFAQLLPSAGPAAVPAPPPLTQEEQKAQQVELSLGKLSLGELQVGHGQRFPDHTSAGASDPSWSPTGCGASGVGQHASTLAASPVVGFASSVALSSLQQQRRQQQQQQMQQMQTDDRSTADRSLQIDIGPLLYKRLGPELGYGMVELKPVEETLRASLVLTTRHLVLLGVEGLRRMALPPLVERWLSDFIVASAEDGQGGGGSSGPMAAA